jgi:hypothetical protein
LQAALIVMELTKARDDTLESKVLDGSRHGGGSRVTVLADQVCDEASNVGGSLYRGKVSSIGEDPKNF